MYSWVSSTTPRAPTDTCSCLPEKHKHQANLACKNSRSPYSLASTVDKWGWQQWCLCHYLRVLCYAMQIFYFHSVCHPVIVSRIVWNSVRLMPPLNKTQRHNHKMPLRIAANKHCRFRQAHRFGRFHWNTAALKLCLATWNLISLVSISLCEPAM